MTKTTIDIYILRVFNLSFGKVYSIKFPNSVLPFSGLKFLFKGCTWEIKGIAVCNKINDENVWDCTLVSDCSIDPHQGKHIIEVIDLKQRFMD